jgi:hypothetical protein
MHEGQKSASNLSLDSVIESVLKDGKMKEHQDLIQDKAAFIDDRFKTFFVYELDPNEYYHYDMNAS